MLIRHSPQGRAKRQFADQIRQFAQRTTKTYLFSGEHFGFLSEFLNNPTSRATGAFGGLSQALTSTFNPSTAVPDFAPVYLILNRGSPKRGNNANTVSSSGEPKESSDEPRSTVTAVKAGDELEAALAQNAPTPNSSLLVFIRGWQSPAWLRILGARCDIDPEMLRRHLGFLAPRKLFDQPSLPSDQLSIWRIRTVTICELSYDTLNNREVQARRERASQDVRRYLQKLGSASNVGSSIIRRYSVIDGTTSVIEHDISLYAAARGSGGWIGKNWGRRGLPSARDDSEHVPFC